MTGCVFKVRKFKPLTVFALFNNVLVFYGTIFQSFCTQLCKIRKYELIKGKWGVWIKKQITAQKAVSGKWHTFGLYPERPLSCQQHQFVWQLNR